MYKQAVTRQGNVSSCSICEIEKKVIIQNFRVDLYYKKNGVIHGNDLITDFVCVDCLVNTLKETANGLMTPVKREVVVDSCHCCGKSFDRNKGKGVFCSEVCRDKRSF